MNIQTIKKNKTFLRFTAVGGFSTAIDFSLLLILKTLGLPTITSNILSTSTAFIFSFLANKKYTFKSTGSSVIKEVILFITLTLIGLWGIQNLIIYISIDTLTALLGDNTWGLIVSKLIATIVSLFWNYIAYSRVVFKH